jgi:hypothetical protein
MISAYVSGVGLRGPGLPGWAGSRAILAGAAPYLPAELARPTGSRLPATERRRATAVTRLAVDVAEETLGGADPAGIATVFTSSGGEVEVIHGIFAELAGGDRRLSPTQFHNSVHNTAAGYWSIATGARTASNSLCGFDDSFGAGLLETLVQCRTEARSVLLVAYDFPPVFPLSEFRKLEAPFGAGLLLTPEAGADTLARLNGEFLAGEDAGTPLDDPGLELLRLGNPAARGLPLLAALAAGRPATLGFGCGMGGSLRVRVEPCR